MLYRLFVDAYSFLIGPIRFISIAKPFHPEDLLAKVRKALGESAVK